MRLTLDMETRSRIDLKKCGVYVYAENSSTDILCMAVKQDNLKTRIWLSPVIKLFLPENHGLPVVEDAELVSLIAAADDIEAHNAQFERLLWKHVMTRYGFKDNELTKYRCSAAKCASYGLPRALGPACEALQLEQKKDYGGYRVMLKMCKPNAKGQWHEDPMDALALCRYCIQDVDSEHSLSSYLPEISAEEHSSWIHDQIVNDRGVKVDLEAIQNLFYKVQYREKQLLLELQQITIGKIRSARQVDVTKKWLKLRGVDLADLTKASVEEVLKDLEDPDARRVLEIRQQLAKSSVSKLATMIRWMCRDGRVRGIFLWHGAATGRWSGKGIQPHNYPRDSFNESQIADLLNMSVEEVETAHGGVFYAASKSLRGMIRAEEGHELLCSDFSSIEARFLAWIAGESWKVQAFRDYDAKIGPDMYILAYSKAFQMSVDAVTKPQRQIGKVMELALGYQGWVGAFAQMAANYGLTYPPEQKVMLKELIWGRQKREGKPLTEPTEDEIFAEWAAPIAGAWRKANPMIVEYWKAVEEAAINAVKTRQPYSFGSVRFGVRGRFLHCRLPSGRLLAYCDPQIIKKETPYGMMKEVIAYMGVDSVSGKWSRQYLYGGLITENIVQAGCRDLLRDAMVRVEAADLPIVMHVHDEIVSEMPVGHGWTAHQFSAVIRQVPAWAEGCPINAEGWVGIRYRK